MLTGGTVGMLPRDNILVVPHVNIILPHDNIHMVPCDNIPMMPHVNTLLCDKMVGWWVPTYALLTPYAYTYHTLKYALYTPPSIRIDVYEFGPKTSWRHPNALATKLHNSLLVKLAQHLFSSC